MRSVQYKAERKYRAAEYMKQERIKMEVVRPEKG